MAFLCSGVPQGSVRGLLLFLIIKYDLVNTFLSHPFTFADDSKCSNMDYTAVQHDICFIHTWCFCNDLQLHPKKCTILQFFKCSAEQHIFFALSVSFSRLLIFESVI